GMTQYLTSVQGMAKEVLGRLEKMTKSFLWGEDKRAPLDSDILFQPISNGSKNMVCLEDRNKATNLKVLQRYLIFDVSRPTWAAFTDRVFAKNVPAAPVVSPDARINPFLQTWSPLILPLKEPCPTFIKTARDFDVQPDGLNIETELKQKMPIWFHIGASVKLNHLNNSEASKWLRSIHKITTV
ncbi:hypothetical protein C8J57DRAFT_948763, partial [Mycena rebaudengoi]